MGIWVVVGVALGFILLWQIGAAGGLLGGVIAWLLWRVKDLQTQVDGLSRQRSIETEVMSNPEALALEKQQQPKQENPSHEEDKKTQDVLSVSYNRKKAGEHQVASSAYKSSIHPQVKKAIFGDEDWFDNLLAKLLPIFTWFSSGNMLVRIGSVVLFFGAGFLLKYAAEHSQLSIEVRMTGIAVLACFMLGAGWYLRASRLTYALALQGGGLGLLYLTIFASFRLYELIPATAALMLLAIVSGAGIMLAVVFNARWLAILSFAGGFLAPILASTGTGSHVALFSWYAVLNIGIAILAWFKAWRSLNLLGMIATFVIVTLWGYQYYRETYFDSVEPFLVGFGLMYLVIGVLFSLHRADPEQESFGRVDASIVFGTPVGFFLLQAPLVHHFEHGMSLTALFSGLIYLLVAWLAYKYKNKTLMIALLSIGGALLTLAIPLEFDEAETASAWAIEGVGLLWLGLKQKSSRALATGMALQILAVASWLEGSPIHGALSYGGTLSAFLIAFSGWACAQILAKHQAWEEEHSMIKGALPFDVVFIFQLWGTVAWVAAGLTELHRHFEGYEMLLSGMAWVCVSAWLVHYLGRRLAWVKLTRINQALILVLWVVLLVQADYASHPWQGWGWLAWLFALPSAVWMLYMSDENGDAIKMKINIFHVATACFVLAMFIWETRWQVNELILNSNANLWKGLMVGLVPSLLLMASSAKAFFWPMSKHKLSYLKASAIIYISVLFIWLFWEMKEPVQSGISYIPIFNPLDVVVILMGMALFKWFQVLQSKEMLWFDKNIFYVTTAFIAFVWMNMDIARVVHHYFHVPWSEKAMLHAVELQASLSISWSLLALVLMLLAGRKHVRFLWLVGAVLLSAVMIKLFTVDMSGSGTLARIISFLGVGGLFLIIGYLAPLPPVEKQEKTES